MTLVAEQSIMSSLYSLREVAMTLTVDLVQLDIVYRSLELMQDRVPPLPDEEQASLADLFSQIEDLKRQIG